MSQDNPSHTAIKPRRKQPRRIKPEYLHNAGLYYLQRFAASKAQFRTVMLRKVRRSCMVHADQDYEQCRQMVEDLVAKFESAGLLNDETFLTGSITSLRRRGLSRQSILFKLKSKGFTDSVILEALESFDNQNHNQDHDPEMIAALKHARKKRLGPFAIQKTEENEKELSNLARQGFRYETIRLVLNLEKAEAEEILAASRFI